MGLIALFSYGLLGFIYIRASPPSSLFPNLYLAGLFCSFIFYFFLTRLVILPSLSLYLSLCLVSFLFLFLFLALAFSFFLCYVVCN